MNVLRITNGFDKLADVELKARADPMTGNANFPTPTPALADVQTAITAFSDALAAAKNGGNYDKAVKNQKRATLINLLHGLTNYVLFTANGDELVAKASGYNIAKSPSPGPPLTPAANQKLEDGPNAGDLKFSFDRVPGAKSYIYQYTPDPLTETSTWQSKPGTVRQTELSGLASGKKYWCRVMAIGINGQGIYSEPV